MTCQPRGNLGCACPLEPRNRQREEPLAAKGLQNRRHPCLSALNLDFAAAVATGSGLLYLENRLVRRVAPGQPVHVFRVGLQQDRFRAGDDALRGIQWTENPSIAITSPNITPPVRSPWLQVSVAGARLRGR